MRFDERYGFSNFSAQNTISATAFEHAIDIAAFIRHRVVNDD